jgi:hypothetical protein
MIGSALMDPMTRDEAISSPSNIFTSEDLYFFRVPLAVSREPFGYQREPFYWN